MGQQHTLCHTYFNSGKNNAIIQRLITSHQSDLNTNQILAFVRKMSIRLSSKNIDYTPTEQHIIMSFKYINVVSNTKFTQVMKFTQFHYRPITLMVKEKSQHFSMVLQNSNSKVLFSSKLVLGSPSSLKKCYLQNKEIYNNQKLLYSYLYLKGKQKCLKEHTI